jgi:CheY-like chemotaxis protein
MKKRILVLDDDEQIRVLFDLILKSWGHDVVCVSSGEEAMLTLGSALLNDEHFDVAILDLTVSDGMGGIEVSPMLKSMDNKIKIIFCSGSDHGWIPDRICYDGFIQKPFRNFDLKTVLSDNLQ